MNEAAVFAQHNLLSFALGIDQNYETPRHVEMIADKLEDLEQRKIKRLMVFMPPRHGKSYLISQLFPAWYLGRNPSHEVIFTTYSQEVASGFGRKVRNLMCEDRYGAIFPETVINDDSSAAQRFNIGSKGGYVAVGAGGPLTSRGGNLIIIDDIHKNRQEAHSETMTQTIKEWYGSTLFTRLMPNAVVVLVQTRWSERDLPGHVLREHGEDWEVLCLPAIDDAGKALWPDRYDIDILLNIKKTIGSHDFEALYQQRPTALEGGIIKREWLRERWKVLPDRFDEMIQSWDLAFTGKTQSDYVAGTVWGRIGAKKYLVDLVHAQMGFTETVQAIKSLSFKWPKARLKVIENKANGPAVQDALKHEVHGIVLMEPEGDKVTRMSAVSPHFEAGNVVFPDPSVCPWVHDAVEELCGFPNSAHDDFCDSVSQALIRMDKSANRVLQAISRM